MTWIDVATAEGLTLPCWSKFALRYGFVPMDELTGRKDDYYALGWLMENKWAIVEEHCTGPTSSWLDTLLDCFVTGDLNTGQWTLLFHRNPMVTMFAFRNSVDAIAFRLMIDG